MTNLLPYLLFITSFLFACFTLTMLPITLYIQGFSGGTIAGVTIGLLLLQFNTCLYIACN